MTKRISYTVRFKLKVVELAEATTSNRNAGKELGINEKLVQELCDLYSIKILNQIFGATPENTVYDLLVLHSANLHPSTIINNNKDATTNNNNYTNKESFITSHKNSTTFECTSRHTCQ